MQNYSCAKTPSHAAHGVMKVKLHMVVISTLLQLYHWRKIPIRFPVIIRQE